MRAKIKLFAIALLSMVYVACNQKNNTQNNNTAVQSQENLSHEGHDHDANASAEEGFIDLLSQPQAKEAGITTDTIKAGTISRQIKLTGEVFFNQDRIVHLVPLISGVVASVNKKLGDPVKQGELMAVIHSRELTDIKSEYLSAIERIANAKINFEREKSLWEKKIISERQYLESKQDYTETRIELQSAERKLHAMGFSEKTIADLPNQPHETLFVYRLDLASQPFAQSRLLNSLGPSV